MLSSNRFTIDRWDTLRFVPQTDVGKAGDLQGRGRRLIITNGGVTEDLVGAKCFMIIQHRDKGRLAFLEMRKLPPFNYIFEMEYPSNVLFYGELQIEYKLETATQTYYSLTGNIKVEDNFFDENKVTNTTEFKVLDESLQKLTLLNEAVERIEGIENGLESLSKNSIELVKGTPGTIPYYSNETGQLRPTSYKIADLNKLNRIMSTYSPGFVIQSDANGNLAASGIRLSDLESLFGRMQTLENAVASITNTGGTEGGGSVVLKTGDKVRLSTSQSGYYTADDALAGINQVTTVSPGDYYIYNIQSNGTVNITQTSSIAGTWIKSASVLTKI